MTRTESPRSVTPNQEAEQSVARSATTGSSEKSRTKASTTKRAAGKASNAKDASKAGPAKSPVQKAVTAKPPAPKAVPAKSAAPKAVSAKAPKSATGARTSATVTKKPRVKTSAPTSKPADDEGSGEGRITVDHGTLTVSGSIPPTNSPATDVRDPAAPRVHEKVAAPTNTAAVAPIARAAAPAPAVPVPTREPAVIASTKAPFPRSATPARRFATRVERARGDMSSWLTDRRAITLSLVPIVVAVGLLAGSAVVVGIQAQTPPAAPVAAASPLSSSQTAAQSWLVANIEPGRTVIVDAALAPGLVGAGWAPADVAIAGEAAAPAWRDVAFVAVSATGDATTDAAVRNSLPVASFGDIEIRRVAPEGLVLAAATESTSAATRREFGAELVRNPDVVMSTPDRVAFAGGAVDERISAVLGALAAAGGVTVTDLPVIAGEDGRTIRQVALGRVGEVPLTANGQPTAQALAIFDALSGEYALDELTVDGADLVLRFSLPSDVTPE